MLPYLKPYELNDLYKRVLEEGESALNEIERFQARQLLKYAQALDEKHINICAGLLSLNPDKKYPKEYKGREFDYWQDRFPFGDEPAQVVEIVSAYLQNPPYTTRIIERLNKYGFKKYLRDQGYKPQKINFLVRSFPEKEHLPRCIALLCAIGFLDYLFKEYGPRTRVYKILSDIFDKNPDTIKKEINSLDPESEAFDTRYKSGVYLPDIKKSL